jgi:hypothetical protein
LKSRIKPWILWEIFCYLTTSCCSKPRGLPWSYINSKCFAISKSWWWWRWASIVCYSNFIIHNMMIKRWVKHFQANMKVILQIMETLWLLIGKKKTNYKFIVIGIWVAYSLFKLPHGLIIFNVVKCLWLKSLLSTWSSMILFL